MVHLCVNVSGMDVKLQIGFDKNNETHVHNALTLACSRSHECHHHLIITVAVNLEASPTPSPYHIC